MLTDAEFLLPLLFLRCSFLKYLMWCGWEKIWKSLQFFFANVFLIEIQKQQITITSNELLIYNGKLKAKITRNTETNWMKTKNNKTTKTDENEKKRSKIYELKIWRLDVEKQNWSSLYGVKEFCMGLSMYI